MREVAIVLAITIVIAIPAIYLGGWEVGKSERGVSDAKAGFPPRENSLTYLNAYKAWYDCEKHFLETGYTIHGELKRPDLFKGVE